MTPCRFDFYLPTNGDYVEEVPFTINGQPISLGGVTFDAQIRLAYDSPAVQLSLSTMSSGAVEGFYITDDLGVLQIRIDRQSIDALYESAVPAAYSGKQINLPYDTIVTLPNGDIEQWFGGYMILNRGITR